MDFKYEPPFMTVEMSDSSQAVMSRVERALRIFAVGDVDISEAAGVTLMRIEVIEGGNPSFISYQVKRVVRGQDTRPIYNFVNVDVNPDYL